MNTQEKLTTAYTSLAQLFNTVEIKGLENHNLIVYAMMLLKEAAEETGKPAVEEKEEQPS